MWGDTTAVLVVQLLPLLLFFLSFSFYPGDGLGLIPIKGMTPRPAGREQDKLLHFSLGGPSVQQESLFPFGRAELRRGRLRCSKDVNVTDDILILNAPLRPGIPGLLCTIIKHPQHLSKGEFCWMDQKRKFPFLAP